MSDEHPSKCSRIQSEEIDYDLGSHKQICEFSINKHDEIRRVYLKEGLYQPKYIDCPYNDDNHRRRKSALHVKNPGYAAVYIYKKDYIDNRYPSRICSTLKVRI